MLRNLVGQADLRIVAFCDRHPERAQALRSIHERTSAVFTDHHALLACGVGPCCVVCLPPYGHSDGWKPEARGLHLLREKPIASNLGAGMAHGQRPNERESRPRWSS
ncbi:MAG: Gfo/Idh/MocA family oxidoreductase [Dehalococcoidia bacterium]|nr:Gfo/Idh/MocA family oxidoreductase [Dehalococcoidia bacterium]